MCIQCALVVFTLEFGLGRCELNAHWTSPPLEVDWNRIRQLCTVNMPHKQQHRRLSLLGHHTYSICRPRYGLRWPIPLGHYWLDASKNKSPLTKWPHVVHQNSHSTSSTTSNKIRQIDGQTLVCVLIHLECWLDKARVKIVTWAAMGAARQQQFSNNSVLKFWQCM